MYSFVVQNTVTFVLTNDEVTWSICTYDWWGHLIDLYLRMMMPPDRLVRASDEVTWSICTYEWWGHLIDLSNCTYEWWGHLIDLYLQINDEVTWSICTYERWGHLINLYLQMMRSPDQFVLTNDEVTWSICTYKWWGHLINLDQSDVWLCMVIQLICRSIICLTPFRKRIDLDQADGWTNHHSWAQLAKKGTSVIR